jgi:hypothetical protein
MDGGLDGESEMVGDTERETGDGVMDLDGVRDTGVEVGEGDTGDGDGVRVSDDETWTP